MYGGPVNVVKQNHGKLTIQTSVHDQNQNLGDSVPIFVDVSISMMNSR